MQLPMIPVLALSAALFVAACTTPQVARGINDPNEDRNRRIHEFNKRVDTNVLRPVATAYGTAVPQRARTGIANFAENLSTPGYVVNDLLQGNVEDAVANTLRFMVNSTFGLGGLLDVATDMGMEERSTDFGETLYTWGVAEGAYVETPIFGPSTDRDRAGRIVDIFTNPLRYVIPSPESYARPVAGALTVLDTRFEFGETVDSVLYDSADSYAQTRLLYLERRRFELQGSTPATEEVYDPNANPFAEYE